MRTGRCGVKKNITYKKAGVDINTANIFKQKIKSLARASFQPAVLRDIGGFGSFFEFAKEKYKEPVLVASSDGVGTKLKIAALVNKHDTIGIDAVAMNVNDILCTGARPLFFLDYIATGKLQKNVLVDVIKGIAEGCRQAGCGLVGGETAEMPGFYKKGEYDLAGFCAGAVDKSDIVDGSKIKAGDVLIGIESNGLHSNGFSLVRNVFSEKELKKYANELLKPTRIYVKPILSLLQKPRTQNLEPIKGIAHVTGGAFYDKIPRVIPKGLGIRVYTDTWPLPWIFKLIQKNGNVLKQEMYHTFNMGIGMVLVVSAVSANKIKKDLAKQGLKSWVIGEVTMGNKRVEII